MKLRNILIGIAVAVTAMVLPFGASAAKNVNVIIPEYPVVINGTRVNNVHREYPFIWYNGITYFPMTYHDCSYLGLYNEYSTKNGNVITLSENDGEYYDYYSSTGYTSKNLKATVAEGKIKVNGTTVRNKYEEYPILNFNDVLYFPLTWDWCMEFDWKINFDTVKGLSVSSNGLSYEGELLARKESDTEKLERQLEYFVYAMNDSDYGSYNYASKNAPERGYDLVMGFIYPYLYDEVFGTDDAQIDRDPRRKYTLDGAYKLPGRNVEWILQNVLNCSATGKVYDNNSYYYKGYYYRPIAATETGIGLTDICDIKFVSRKSNGTYEITADICSDDMFEPRVWYNGTIKATVGVKEENGIRYWSFYSISVSGQNSSSLKDAYIEAKGKWLTEIIDEYAWTSVFKPDSVSAVSKMRQEIVTENGREYYKIHTVITTSEWYFSPSVWIYVDSETGECHHNF